MKDTEQRYSIHIYDSRFVDRLNNLYQRNKNLYRTLNPFLVDCLYKGVETLEQEEQNIKEMIRSGDIYNEMKRLILILNKIVDEGHEHYKESFVQEQVTQTLVHRVYSMILNQAKKNNIPYSSYEKGIFDNLPKDLEEKINLLNKEFDSRGNT